MPLFSISFRELLSPGTEQEMDQFLGQFSGYMLEEHADDGSHTNVTADTVTTDTVTTGTIEGPVDITGLTTIDRVGINQDTVMTPAQITSSQNNWNPVDASDPLLDLQDVSVIRMESDAARDITGITAPTLIAGSNERNQVILILVNKGNFTITLKHNSSSSSSANRIVGGNNSDVQLGPNGTAILWYDSGSGNWRNVAAPIAMYSGTYTPTITNGSNVAASTAYVCQYMRVGSVVTVSGRVDIDPTLDATVTKFELSLPVASVMSSSGQLAGTMMSNTTTVEHGPIFGNTTSDEAQFDWTVQNTSNHTIYFHFTYLVS